MKQPFSFVLNGIYIASNSYDEIVVWDVERKEMKYPSLGSYSTVLSIAFSHDSLKIKSGSLDKIIHV